MKVELLFLGKTKDSYLAEGIDKYKKRLNYYTSVSVKIIKTKVRLSANDELLKAKEGQLLLNNTVKGSFIVALDSGGKQYTSTGISGLINRWEQRGVRVVSFLIGGPVGLSEEVIQKADMVLSLSYLTFTHDMVRMLLLEQLYRGYTIKNGEKYHK